MTRGDLMVEGVDGDKKLQLFASALKVDVGTGEGSERGGSCSGRGR